MGLTKMDIIKIQRSISTSEYIQQVLIYNEDRSIFEQCDMTPDINQLFLEETDLKIYHYAYIDNKGTLHIEGVAPEQEW